MQVLKKKAGTANEDFRRTESEASLSHYDIAPSDNSVALATSEEIRSKATRIHRVAHLFFFRLDEAWLELNIAGGDHY